MSSLFEFPNDRRKEEWGQGDIVSALRDAVNRLPYAVPAINSFDSFGELSNIDQIYTRIFDNCRGKAAVPIYEKDYCATDPQQLWEELIRFYEFFDLQYDLGDCGEWPDHINTELQFLHYLTFLEASRQGHQLESVVTAQKDFLDRHLSCWVPKLVDRLGEFLTAESDPGPYGPIFQILKQFIEADHEFSMKRNDVKSRAQPNSPAIYEEADFYTAQDKASL
jgi:DMSO reductase family type II enzyme chaperone